MANVYDAEVLKTFPTSPSTTTADIELADWTFPAALLEGGGMSIDQVLAGGGTFFGRELLDAWRFLPPNGWRLVFEDRVTRVYAAPEPGSVGEWAVATLRLSAGVWQATGAERNLFPRPAGEQTTKNLDLVWPSEQIIVRGRPARLFAKVKNEGSEPWLADDSDSLSVVAWLIELPSNRRLLASRAELARSPTRGGTKSILVPPGAAIIVPVQLATIAPETLLAGTYGIVGRLEQLNLTSQIGTVSIVER